MRECYEAIAVMGTIFLFIIGIGLGVTLAKNDTSWQNEAISHGYASYEIVDQKTGKTEFKWKEQGK